MAHKDFKFLGKTTSTNTNGSNAGQNHLAYLIAQGNGAGGSTNGGYAMEGQSQLHSALSASITTCGDYCRAWLWSDGRYTSSGYDYNWAGMAFVTTRSLGERLTPDSGSAWSAAATFANSTGKRTEATAISIRATVRLGAATGSAGGDNVSSSLGSTIGIFCGARPESLTVTYSNHSGTDDSYTMYTPNGGYGTLFAGYTLQLSSVNHYGTTVWGGDGTSVTNSNLGQEGVRLIMRQTAPDVTNLGAGGRISCQPRQQVCTGTYQFNKWYRIRMDVTPLPGCDKIEAYTAPATDTIGSETWTKVKTHYVWAGQPQFWYKTNAHNRKGIGYCVSSHRHEDLTADDRNHDCFIDAFTVFSKKISA